MQNACVKHENSPIRWCLLVFPVSGRERVIPGWNRVFAADAAVPALRDELSTASMLQHVARRVDCFLLRSVNTCGTTGSVSFVSPLAVRPLGDGSVGLLTHRCAFLLVVMRVMRWVWCY